MTAVTQGRKSAAWVFPVSFKNEKCSCFINGWEFKVISRKKTLLSLVSSRGCHLQNVTNLIIWERFWEKKEKTDNVMQIDTILFSSLLTQTILEAKWQQGGEKWMKQPLPSLDNCTGSWQLWARGLRVGPKQAGSPVITVIVAHIHGMFNMFQTLSSCFMWIRLFNLHHHSAE